MNSLLKKSTIFFLIFNSGNFISFIFEFILARVLNVGSFGVYNSLMSFATLISFPTIIILFLVSSEIANQSKFKIKIKIFENSIFCLSFSIIITLFFLIFLNQIMNYLKIENSVYLILIFFTSIFALFSSIFAGIAQGLSQYIQQSLIQTSPLFFRLIFLIIFCYLLSFNLYGALLANLFSTLIPIIFGLYFYKSLFKINKKYFLFLKNFHKRISYNKIIIYFLNSILILLVLNIDIIIVKHFNSDYQTGIYSSSALLAKIIFFLTLFLTNINFRETLSTTNTKSKKIIINLISAIIIIFSSLIMYFFFKFFDDLIFKFTFGDNFIEGKLYFYKQLVHFTILSLIALITYICISHNIFINLIISILFYIFLFIFLNLYKSLLISSFLNILILFDFIVLFINMLFLISMYKFKIT